MFLIITRYVAVLLLGIVGGLALSRVTLDGITLGAQAELWVTETWVSSKKAVRESKVYRDVRSFRNLVKERMKEHTSPKNAGVVAAPINPKENPNPHKLSFSEEDAAFMMELLQAENKK